MDVAFPYTRYACPCADHVSTTPTSQLGKRSSQEVENDAEDEHTFNPHDVRANFSLYPLDRLLFCDECTSIKCEKCWTEEILYWYCPNCLFEVASSMVKSDGNRCARHCYDCPLCSSSLSTTVMNRHSDSHLRPDSSSSPEFYILQCQYCEWSSLDIGVTFTRHNKITEQLNKIWKSRTIPEESKQNKNESLSHENAFANLSNFYKDQLSESGDASSAYANSPSYSSPAHLARIMSLYGGLSLHTQKKMKEKPQPMREAGNRAEGLSTFSVEDRSGDDELLHKMSTLGMEGSASQQQQLQAPSNNDMRFSNDLWPTATKLKATRGKRCRTCRQFVARPETKVGSMRYKVRLLAMHHIPRLSIKPLQTTAQLHPANSVTFHMRPEPVEPVILQPNHTRQYVLTIRNPIFETIKVTLATPATTPGRVASKVTILCPSFTIGAAGDRWEEALAEPAIGLDRNAGRKAAMASLIGSAEAERQPEAGKVWERSKSAVSVIVEVVPGALHGDDQRMRLDEDEDILEIPIYVRAEWEAMPSGVHAPDTTERETRELAYWSVLGIGRIARG